MCIAVPGKIKKIVGMRVWVQYPHETREVLVGDEKVKEGDYVLVQMGIVVKILSEKETLSSVKAWNEISK